MPGSFSLCREDYSENEVPIEDLKDDLSAPSPKEPPAVLTRTTDPLKCTNCQVTTTRGEPIDLETGSPQAGDTSQLHRKLKSRHIQMIAIGGAIGAGLFIGSGNALATGGPCAVILGFSLVGFMLFCTVNALGELATIFPVQGAQFD